jgi:hypothetical protein
VEWQSAQTKPMRTGRETKSQAEEQLQCDTIVISFGQVIPDQSYANQCRASCELKHGIVGSIETLSGSWIEFKAGVNCVDHSRVMHSMVFRFFRP